MIYGEKLYSKRYYLGKNFIQYKFRCEPVPFVRKRVGSWFRCWYKTPKTINERRQFYGSKEYIRLKRNPINLPERNDDYLRSDIRTRKSWKKRSKCRKQWEKYVKMG